MRAVIKSELGVDVTGMSWTELAEVYNDAVFVRKERVKEIVRELACRRM